MVVQVAGKRAVSEIVAYVLLISISLSLAGMVYVWLKDYVPSENGLAECEENVGLVIRDYNYSCATKSLNLTIENKGLFDVDGYIIRVNNLTLAKLGLYTLNRTGKPLAAGEVYSDYYSLVNQTDEIPHKNISGYLTFVDVQPFLKKNGKNVYCSNYISKQSLSC
ncbi:Uncharacterised protein [uncultured archaeon]|nr:Uncharacterised protein [uncultured archaeon]